MRFKFNAPWHHIFSHEGEDYHGGSVVEIPEEAAAGESRLEPTDEEVSNAEQPQDPAGVPSGELLEDRGTSQDPGMQTIQEPESQGTAEVPAPEASENQQAAAEQIDAPPADTGVPATQGDVPDNTNVGEGDERVQDQ